MLPGVLGRQHALELYQAHREIADYQIRDGQFERALDSLNRAHTLTFPGGMTARLRRKEWPHCAANVETLAQMGMVLRLAGKPQEAERRFREALEIIHRPWPKYLLGDEVVTTGRAIDRLSWQAF